MDARFANSLEKGERDDRSIFFSHTRCCCLLFLLLALSLMLLCASSFLVLRPKKPIFSLHAVQIESLKLEVTSSKQISFPSSMASLFFSMQNPNKIGIRYTSSELDVWSQEMHVGVIQVPTFYQPPRSRNVSVIMRAQVERLNLTGLVDSSGDSRLNIRIIGCIGARTHLMNFHLPWIKFSLNCQVGADYGGLVSFHKELTLLKSHQALLLPTFPHLSQNCSLAFCI